MEIEKTHSLSVFYLLSFLLIYLDNLSAALATSDSRIIQTAVEWNDTFCEAKRFNQTIQAQGCETIHVMNNYCHGQCRSLFMPYKKQGLFSCYLCVPVKKRIQNITLQCKDNDETKQKQINVTMVERCECKRTRFQHTLPPK